MGGLSSSFDMEMPACVSLEVVREKLQAIWIFIVELFAVISPVSNLNTPIMRFLENQHRQKLNYYLTSVNLYFVEGQLDK